jgi:hypothetical protein
MSGETAGLAKGGAPGVLQRLENAGAIDARKCPRTATTRITLGER